MAARVAEAQHPDPLARAAAAEKREAAITEEQQKIAAGAMAPSVRVITRYDRPAKLLSVVKTEETGAGRFGTPEERRERRRQRAELPSSDEIFEPLSGDDEPTISKKCHECGAEAEDQLKTPCCLSCFSDPDIQCKKCGEWIAHRYCTDCLRSHTHVSKLEIENQSGHEGAARTYREHLKSEHPDWPWLDDPENCVNCGQELRALMDQSSCWSCNRKVCPSCREIHECEKISTIDREDESAIN